MNAAYTVTDSCRAAITRRPLIFRNGGWYYGRRRFPPTVVRSVISEGSAVQIGNFIVRDINDIGRIGMQLPGVTFETMTVEAQSLLRRAVVSSQPVMVKMFTESTAPYEIVIAGFAIIDGFTIVPSDEGRRVIIRRAYDLVRHSNLQTRYMFALAEGTDEKFKPRADTLGRLEKIGIIAPDPRYERGHSLTKFGTEVVNTYKGR